jgi:hypothetical protein
LNISKAVFYTKEFDKEINYPVDVILSPEFYWIKKIDIPIKNLFQAKKIARNIFDLENEYIYDAFKIEDKYFAIAVSKNLKLKIDKKYIKSLRIAQMELFSYNCLNINEKYSLKKIEDILFCFPKDKNCPQIDDVLKNLKLSNYTVSLDTVNLDKTSLFLIFSSFVFLISYFLISTISYKKELIKIEEKKEKLKKYNLPLTTFQLDAIYNNLKSIDKKQNSLRRDLEIFSNTPLKKNEEYIKLLFNKNYYVKIKTSKNLDYFFKKHFSIIKSSFNNNIYTAKLADE